MPAKFILYAQVCIAKLHQLREMGATSTAYMVQQ